jgi:hypothetical protein
MRRFSESAQEPERFVLYSERTVLECPCGERIIVLGHEDDWYAEGRSIFECGCCGRMLTFAPRVGEGGPSCAEVFDEVALELGELLERYRRGPIGDKRSFGDLGTKSNRFIG